ncbi:hypothetical protein BDR26DRAFT_893143 [Obelidium mucronatum]|nr:hypothetical protein BDR26DRAFT_893143 [Obelidium mucronatum]
MPTTVDQGAVPSLVLTPPNDGINGERSTSLVIPSHCAPPPSARSPAVTLNSADHEAVTNHPVFYINPEEVKDGYRIIASIRCPTSEYSPTFQTNLPSTLTGRIASSVYSIRIQELNGLLGGRQQINDYAQLWYLLIIGYFCVAMDLAVYLLKESMVPIYIGLALFLPVIPIGFLSYFLAKQKPYVSICSWNTPHSTRTPAKLTPTLVLFFFFFLKFVRKIERHVQTWNEKDAPLKIKTCVRIQASGIGIFGIEIVLEVFEEVNMDQRLSSSDTVGRRSMMIRYGRPSLGLPTYNSPAPSYKD